MIRAAIVTPWTAATGSTPELGNHPQFDDDYTYIRWEDITAQPSENLIPSPNEYTLLVEVADDVFATLEADEDYEILWSEVIDAQAN